MDRYDLGLSAFGIRRELMVGDGEVITRHTENVSPILDANQRQRNDGGGRVKSGHHVARIPLTTYYAWRKEWKEKFADKWEFSTFLSMRLRDRDYAKLRTSDMRA